MVKLSEEDYQKFKELSKAHGHTYRSEREMKQSADSLVRLMRVLDKAERDELARKERLKRESNGFSLQGHGRNCALCGQIVMEKDGWYDKWGFKCMNCQDAVNKKRIPGSLCGDYDHERCITASDLSRLAGVRVQKVHKLIKQGKIRARQIPNGPYLILKKDNKGVDIFALLEGERRG